MNEIVTVTSEKDGWAYGVVAGQSGMYTQYHCCLIFRLFTGFSNFKGMFPITHTIEVGKKFTIGNINLFFKTISEHQHR